MIRRIKLSNFMSHKDTVIEPAEGLTILAGQNNCGKSAVVAALQIVCGNTRGDYMVRHGEKECVIEVETIEGHVVQWRRKAKAVTYTLNGREVSRLKNSIPDDLHDLLRLPVVEADGDDFDIHFGEQKKPIFLLNDSPSRRATFFASSSDAVKLLEMQNVHRRKMQEASTRERDLSIREGQLKTRLERLEPIEKLEPRLEQLEKQYTDLTAADEQRRNLKTLIQGLDEASNLVKQWSNEAKTLCELQQPPAIHDTTLLRDAIRQTKRLANQIEFSRELQAASSPLAEPPAVSDTQRLSKLINEITVGGLRIQQQSSRCGALASVEGPPNLNDLSRIEDLISRYDVISRRVAETAYEQTILSDVVQLPAFNDTSELLAAISQIEKAQQSQMTVELEVQASRESLTEAEHDLLHRAEDLETCPVCGQDFDPDKLIASAAIRAGDAK